MATRLDPLRDREATPMAGALDQLFGPAQVREGLVKGEWSQPEFVDADQLLREGGFRLGGGDYYPDQAFDPWDSYFDAQGNVVDPGGLLFALNAVPLLAPDPLQVTDAFGFGGGQSSVEGYGRPDREWFNPDPLDTNSTGYFRDAPGTSYQDQINASMAGWAPELRRRVGMLDDFNARINDPRERFVDPRNAFFTDYELAPGVDLRNASMEELDAWAQENYGTDLFTLAAMGPEQAQTRMEWEADPSLWFDPSDPSGIDVTTLPGIRPDDWAERVEAYKNAYKEYGDEMDEMAGAGRQQRITAAFLNDPEVMRTALGDYLAGQGGFQETASQLGYGAAQAGPMQPDYSFLWQSGIQPSATSGALAQMMAGVV